MELTIFYLFTSLCVSILLIVFTIESRDSVIPMSKKQKIVTVLSECIIGFFWFLVLLYMTFFTIHRKIHRKI